MSAALSIIAVNALSVVRRDGEKVRFQVDKG